MRNRTNKNLTKKQEKSNHLRKSTKKECRKYRRRTNKNRFMKKEKNK